MKFDEYVRYDAVGLAERIAAKDFTAREVLECALERTDAVNGKLHAVIHRLDARARDAADGELPEGPFRGVPFLVKDLDGTLASAPYNAGSRSLARHVATNDSELFKRYKAAGFVIAGKTNTPEFGLVAFTEPALHGATYNPWDLSRTPGGSSGGSAAAVAAGIVPAAHAGDGGGSIRIPASACGLFGLKPTRARMPLGPDVGDGWNGFVVPHVVTRSVRDSAAILDATHGPDDGAPYRAPTIEGTFSDALTRAPKPLRIAFSTRSLLGVHTDTDCVRALKESMLLCESLGHHVEEAEPTFDRDAVRFAYLTVVAACTAMAVENTRMLTGVKPRPELFEPTTWYLAQVGWSLSAAEYEAARDVCSRTTREVARFFHRYDVFATSTLAHPPARIGELLPNKAELAGMALMRAAPVKVVLVKTLEALSKKSFEKTPNTMLFNITGQPAMTVPLSHDRDNLPVGTQFVARVGEEQTLLSLAAQLERAKPWFDRRPAL